ncbi:hypothetical protein Tco_0061512, partial [Tanacetum coccineum]
MIRSPKGQLCDEKEFGKLGKATQSMSGHHKTQKNSTEK